MTASRPLMDREAIAETCLALTAISSPTGHERKIAEWIAARLVRAGIDARAESFGNDRANLVARRPGTGGGAELLLYSPIDTAFSAAGDTTRAAAAGQSPAFRSGSTRVGDWIVGPGAENPKGFATAVLVAFETLCAGPAPSGDLVLALTAGGMPTPGLADRPDSDGLGRGCRQFLATHPRPDLALIAKPGDAVSVEEAGIALFRVRVGGDLAYTGTRHRAPVRHALLDAARLVDRLEAWFPRYSAAAATPTVTPQAAVTAIRGGWPDEPAFLPSVCEVWIDMRLAPGATLDEVEALLAAAVADAAAGLESDISVERLGGFPGAATPRDAWIARAAIRAWEARTGRPHVEATATSGVTDASLLRAAGIPTARIGMPRPAVDPPYSGFSMGVVHIDPMTALATTLVDVAGDTLSRPRSEVLGGERVAEVQT